MAVYKPYKCLINRNKKLNNMNISVEDSWTICYFIMLFVLAIIASVSYIVISYIIDTVKSYKREIKKFWEGI